MLHTKYVSCGPHGFRKASFFYFFFHYKSMGANEPQAVASLNPRGLTGRIYVGENKHCHILNI